MDTSRYVEFDYVNNGRTYSMEFLKLFQAVCSEIDVLGKCVASVGEPSFQPTKNTGINEWWFFITEKDATLIDRRCRLYSEKDLQPWKGYSQKWNDRGRSMQN